MIDVRENATEVRSRPPVFQAILEVHVLRTEIEKPNRAGLGLMGFAALWALGWGIVGALLAGSEMNSLTPAELDDSIWSVEGPLMIVYGMSPALAALVGGIGALVYSHAKRSAVWRFSLGAIVGLGVAVVMMQGTYMPRLFGIGGALILLSFFGILWFWARERLAHPDAPAASAHFRLAGYAFLLMATWFTCGIGSQPFLDGLEGRDPTNPIHIMLLLALGWLSLFLSHYTASILQDSKTSQGGLSGPPPAEEVSVTG